MKKLLLFTVVLLALMLALAPVCLAEEVVEVVETETAEDVGTVTNGEVTGWENLSYTEKEQMVRDVLDALLEKGDESFAGKEWWEVVATWVRSNLGSVVAGIAGVLTLVGSLWLICRTNPKFKAYVNSLGTACKSWFETIGEKTNEVAGVLREMAANIKEMKRTIAALKESNMLLIETLEDVIKLSGADEGKKEIYIKTIEEAKKACNEGGGGDEE